MAAGYILYMRRIAELENEERIRENKMTQRILRDNSNPFSLPDHQFLKYFRLSKLCVHYIANELQPYLEQNQRITATPHILQILATLHFFGHGSYQFDVGQAHVLAMSQPSISRSIEKICNILVQHFTAEWIKFPVTDVLVNRKKERLMEKFNMPGCIGAIDCTHIAIIGPPLEHPVYPRRAYYNRKRYTSINTQIICDADLNILNINARFPGSTHDSAIWMTSIIKQHLEQKFINGENNNIYLIGKIIKE